MADGAKFSHTLIILPTQTQGKKIFHFYHTLIVPLAKMTDSAIFSHTLIILPTQMQDQNNISFLTYTHSTPGQDG